MPRQYVLLENAVRKCLTILFPLMLLALPVAVYAEIVRGLHAATVPVVNQSAEALAGAASDALGQVVVKVSGSVDALQHPVVQEALPEARSHVQQYAYVRDEGPEAALSARFEFDSSYVNRLLGEAGLSLWTANRPPVLVWMALEQQGDRQLVNALETPELARQLLQEFDRRGVPARLPLFDLRDATAIDVSDVWAQHLPTILAASARYDVNDIMVGRVVVVSSGSWAGEWSYITGPDRLDRSGNAPSATGFLQEGVNLVAESMASRYAVALSDAPETGVRMVVNGVHEFADYAAIVNWLESLELISHANVQRIDRDRIELGLDAAAGADQLRTIIELNERLQPIANTSAELVYQWTN